MLYRLKLYGSEAGVRVVGRGSSEIIYSSISRKNYRITLPTPSCRCRRANTLINEHVVLILIIPEIVSLKNFWKTTSAALTTSFIDLMSSRSKYPKVIRCLNCFFRFF